VFIRRELPLCCKTIGTPLGEAVVSAALDSAANLIKDSIENCTFLPPFVPAQVSIIYEKLRCKTFQLQRQEQREQYEYAAPNVFVHPNNEILSSATL
jgi:hypothetical protein